MSVSEIQKQRLQSYLETEKEVLAGQEYQTGKRRIRRAELSSVNSGINQLLAAGAGCEGPVPGTRARRCIFRD